MASVGYGSSLSGATLGTIGSIVSLTHSGAKAKFADASTMQSPGRYVQKLKGIVDSGEFMVACRLNLASGDPNKHKAAIDALTGAVTLETFTVTFPNGTLTFSGYIKSCKPFDASDPSEAIGFELTIKVSGRIS